MMPISRLNIYVGSVCSAAILCGAFAYTGLPAATSSELSAVVVLALLAAVAEFLTFGLPRTSKGSLAFIPYLAAIMVVPSSTTIGAATAVKLLCEVVSKRAWPKRFFNVAQLSVSLTFAVVAYRQFGGHGMLSDGIESLIETTRVAGAAALTAFVVAFAVNTLLVQGVIAIATGERLARVVRENVLPSFSVDILASPIVFVFAWIFSTHGSIAALGIWVPILGVRQLTRAKLELEQTNQELLELMVRSIEARDAYTSGHSRRVREFANIIARVIGLSERETEQVTRAALLHDVGKIHEKYAPILAKADKLTPDEWQLMQQHPMDGAELVGTMTKLRDLIPSIKHHHERWDGRGYPSGLQEMAIPLGARIIALADTIDAMTSERPYRPAMSGDDVRCELIACRGKQFDPDIVDRLLSPSAWVRIFPPARTSRPYGTMTVLPRPSKGDRRSNLRA